MELVGLHMLYSRQAQQGGRSHRTKLIMIEEIGRIQNTSTKSSQKHRQAKKNKRS